MAAKSTIKHPYAAIEHRVIDSPAYADLTYAARSLLVLITRQLTKSNNGHLQATFTYMQRFGFSVNTLSRATHELITHGMIYKTKSGGFHLGAAQFAVTWLTISNKAGIYLQGFQPFAWRDWQPSEKKCRPPKLGVYSIKNGEQTPQALPKTEADTPPKSEHNELCHVGCINTGVLAVTESTSGISETIYIRERDSELTGGYWDADLGEYIKPSIITNKHSSEDEKIRKVIEFMVSKATQELKQ